VARIGRILRCWSSLTESRCSHKVPATRCPLPELRRVLIDLPIEAWPYGRVVGVQRPSISSGAVGEPEAIEANLKVVRDVLAALNVDFNGWPA